MLYVNVVFIYNKHYVKILAAVGFCYHLFIDAISYLILRLGSQLDFVNNIFLCAVFRNVGVCFLKSM